MPNVNIMGHSVFDREFDKNFADEELGKCPHEKLSNDKHEGAKKLLKKSHHATPTKYKLLQKDMSRVNHQSFKTKWMEAQKLLSV